MPETSANPAGAMADLLRYLVEAGTAALPERDLPVGLAGDYTNPGAAKPPPMSTRDLGKAVGGLVPQSTADVILSATPLGLVRKANPRSALRQVIGSGHGLTQRELLGMLDNAMKETSKAVRRKSTGEVFGPSRGMNPDYHDELVMETVDQGLVPYDAYDELEHGYLMSEQYLDKNELDDALTEVLSRLFSR